MDDAVITGILWVHGLINTPPDIGGGVNSCHVFDQLYIDVRVYFVSATI